MNKSKKGRMPVQGKGVIRGTNQGNFQNGVEAQFWGAVAGIASTAASVAIPLITSLISK